MTQSPAVSPPKPKPTVQLAGSLFAQQFNQIYRRTDRLFAGLMAVQWVAGVIAACLISPTTWSGTVSSVHPHVFAALFLGGAIAGLTLLVALALPGRAFTRHVIAVCQMLMSSLLIDISGGRIETHFHVFGSLAFLAFYRDWKVIVTASIIVATDHLVRGLYWPATVFGSSTRDMWRVVEHAGWVVFEDVFLILATVQSVAEMRRIADKQARLETTEAELTVARDNLEAQVLQRTCELAATNENLLQQISERERAEEVIRWNASHDVLTGMPNRGLFLERLLEVIEQARHRNQPATVIFIDLDRFKIINDTFGHDAGDFVLCEASSRIKDCLRTEDVIARLGGDEFTALLPGLSEHEATKTARSILERLDEPIRMGDNEFRISASIGISVYPQDGTDPELLLKNADSAMYRAKGIGGGFLAVFAQEMSASSVERLKLEMGLRHAVEREEMVLFYQPQTSSRTGEIVGVEALVRWRHPEMGIVPPTNFIPLAEETGLIIPIGKWILEQACRQGKIWADRGHDLRMSVNISARQFEQNDLGAMIEAITRETGFDARMLDVELTESAMMSRGDAAISLMAGLKDLGVQLAVDDFGTGYSSLSYLRHFPLDILKVDRSFVRGIESNEVDIAIIRAVVDLAHAIGLTVVAEGVETKTQSALLQELGCDVLQGYLFSPPLPVDDIDRLLARLDNIEIEDDNRVQSLAA